MLASGSRLGVFEIVGLLGAGRMGEVYRARDTTLQREVAVKILTFAADTERVAVAAVARGDTRARCASR